MFHFNRKKSKRNVDQAAKCVFFYIVEISEYVYVLRETNRVFGELTQYFYGMSVHDSVVSNTERAKSVEEKCASGNFEPHVCHPACLFVGLCARHCTVRHGTVFGVTDNVLLIVRFSHFSPLPMLLLLFRSFFVCGLKCAE